MTERSTMDVAPTKWSRARLVRERRAPWLLASLSLAVTLWGWRATSSWAVDRREPLVVLTLGLTISLLLFAVVRSIAERAQAEEEVRQLAEQLEQRVLERTAQLEAATRELEAFSYSVSHDLRAPLRHIHGFTKLLRERAPQLDETTVRYLNTISTAAVRMGDLIDDLLALSRTGRAELRAQDVDLTRLVSEVSEECAQEAKGRRVVWKLGALPRVTGDPALLRVVFVNLLSNAVKFTARREEAVIEVDAAAGESGEVIVRVKDNGAGFDGRYVDKLFGVFQRLHREDEFEGTGIGLATVQRVVHRHGGRVWAEGAIDAGATFYVTLKGAAERINGP
jgi:light-regulated signal transduction histidine kinase (bacteriophytochrome)